MILDCKTEDDFESICQRSRFGPQFLIKHSSRCPASRAAMTEFRRLSRKEKDIAFWRILVIEDRELSKLIADKTGINHQSPQVMLFRHGRAVWYVSHSDINTHNMRKALSQL